MTPAVNFLQTQGIDFELLEYDLSNASNLGIEAARSMGLEEAQVFKTLIAALDDRRLVVAIIPVAQQLNLKLLSQAAGARRARMADIAAAEKTTGYVTGGISPFGQKKPLPTFLASEALELERIYVSGGKRGLEIALATQDLVRCCQATVCKLSRGC
jgi:Cys-tRNA(Pro)/Cys-tRNA(Cys) deacylase